MTQISEVYQQAQFALAAYATLTPSLTRDDYIEALSNEGMTTAQAQQFADQYKVVDNTAAELRRHPGARHSGELAITSSRRR